MHPLTTQREDLHLHKMLGPPHGMCTQARTCIHGNTMVNKVANGSADTCSRFFFLSFNKTSGRLLCDSFEKKRFQK